MLDARNEKGKRVPQESYFIDEVIVGPTPVPELTVEAIHALFASESKQVPVMKSDIPYRNW